MPAQEKRIPVTAERYRELDDLKGPNQTFDELLEELVEEFKKARLMRHINELREEQEEFTPLDEV